MTTPANRSLFGTLRFGSHGCGVADYEEKEGSDRIALAELKRKEWSMNIFCSWRNVYLMTVIILSMANGAEAQANL